MLRNELAREFRLADEMQRVARRAFTAKTKIIHEGGVDRRVVEIGLGLLSKACKLHKSIILVCERGLSQEAETLHRSLFESFVTIEWILKKVIRLSDRRGRRKPIVPKDLFRQTRTSPLTTQLRAKLYAAHSCLESERLLKVHDQTPGLKRLVRKEERLRVAREVAAAKQLIGVDWFNLVDKTKSYHGLPNLAVLATVLGPKTLQIYGQTYKLQSWSTHGLDAFAHIQRASERETVLFQVDPRAVSTVLIGSTIRLFQSVERVNKRFGAGLESALSSFGGRFRRAFG